MKIRIGDNVTVHAYRAVDFVQPFCGWIAEGRSAVVVSMIRGSKCNLPHAVIAFGNALQDRMCVAIKDLKKQDKPGDEG
jgi:hypothetical protein